MMHMVFFCRQKTNQYNYSVKQCILVRKREYYVMRTSKMSLNSNDNNLACLMYWAVLCWNPHPNWMYSSRDIAILAMLKQQNSKEIEFYYWLYLKINIPTHFAWSHHKWFVDFEKIYVFLSDFLHVCWHSNTVCWPL